MTTPPQESAIASNSTPPFESRLHTNLFRAATTMTWLTGLCVVLLLLRNVLP